MKVEVVFNFESLAASVAEVGGCIGVLALDVAVQVVLTICLEPAQVASMVFNNLGPWNFLIRAQMFGHVLVQVVLTLELLVAYMARERLEASGLHPMDGPEVGGHGVGVSGHLGTQVTLDPAPIVGLEGVGGHQVGAVAAVEAGVADSAYPAHRPPRDVIKNLPRTPNLVPNFTTPSYCAPATARSRPISDNLHLSIAEDKAEGNNGSLSMAWVDFR